MATVIDDVAAVIDNVVQKKYTLLPSHSLAIDMAERCTWWAILRNWNNASPFESLVKVPDAVVSSFASEVVITSSAPGAVNPFCPANLEANLKNKNKKCIASNLELILEKRNSKVCSGRFFPKKLPPSKKNCANLGSGGE